MRIGCQPIGSPTWCTLVSELRHDALAVVSSFPVEQQLPGYRIIHASTDMDLDLDLAVQVGAGGQEDALRGGQDRFLAGLPQWTVDVVGGVADLHLVVSGNTRKRGSQPSRSQLLTKPTTVPKADVASHRILGRPRRIPASLKLASAVRMLRRLQLTLPWRLNSVAGLSWGRPRGCSRGRGCAARQPAAGQRRGPGGVLPPSCHAGCSTAGAAWSPRCSGGWRD